MVCWVVEDTHDRLFFIKGAYLYYILLIIMEFFNKIRPQIILAIFSLAAISIVALFMDGDQYIAVVTGALGGIIALGMKLLDGE